MTIIEAGMLQWFGQVERMSTIAVTKKLYRAQVSGRGRPILDQIGDVLVKGHINVLVTGERTYTINECTSFNQERLTLAPLAGLPLGLRPRFPLPAAERRRPVDLRLRTAPAAPSPASGSKSESASSSEPDGLNEPWGQHTKQLTLHTVRSRGHT